MTELTKEQLIEEAKLKIAIAKCHPNSGMAQVEGELFKIALASLEAEPVAWKATFTQIDNEYNTFIALYSDKAEAERWVRLHEIGDFRAEITPLYAAPPAMVVPDEMDLLTCHLDGVTETYADGWNACRAAMLHSAEPVSQTYKLPPLSSNEVNDAAWKLRNMLTEHGPLNGRQFNKLKECFYEALKVAMRNSPVTPDGWISCSERMPEIRQTVIGWNGYAIRQCVYTRNGYAKTQKGREPRFETSTGIWHGVTHWMPLPEPPQQDGK
ncbi:DUF551 domain-containing protein [Escherichia marmotae]|uniref:DUF551 domain-containing protein n=1 Tax=Escherichia marmotae TaxID=1499973 RepID=UPI00281108DE|nr:DUF551 domain-containing protein [Escherichia marmotae]